jgi:hypothetical protein
MQTPPRKFKKRRGQDLDTEPKEYIPPKGKYILLNLNMCIIIVLIWWLILYGISNIDKDALQSFSSRLSGDSLEATEGRKLKKSKSRARKDKDKEERV